MTTGGKYLVGVIALTGFVSTACSNSPMSPSAVNQSLGLGGSSSAGGASSGAPRVTTLSGGGGLKPPAVDTIKVTKCYYDAPTGEMLIKASSSDVTARLFAYRPDGSYAGEVQNGGGSRYGGTVMAGSPTDPGTMTITSSSGGSVTVPTTPFQI